MPPIPVLVTTSSFAEADASPREELLKAGLEVHENPHKRKLTEAEVLELFSRFRPSGLVAGLEPLTVRVLESGRGHLKAISRCGTGLENVDLEAARRLGISVFNTPEAPAPAVAELAVGLMLAVLRRIAEADRSLREGRWKALQGGLLEGRTVGIVGFGRIGSRVAVLCRGFGCRMLVCDVRELPDSGPRRAGLDELLRESDVVTLHVPLREETRRLIGPERIRMMRPGAVLINVSRGGLVDEEALAEALRSGRLSGAGLDVFEAEPYRGPLASLDNAVLTCHMGSAAKECRVRMEREAARNLVAGLRRSGVLG